VAAHARFFRVGTSIFKDFSCRGGPLADLSRQVDPVDSRVVWESNGVATTGKQSKNSLHVTGGSRNRYNFDEVNSLCNKQKCEMRQFSCVNRRDAIVAYYKKIYRLFSLFL